MRTFLTLAGGRVEMRTRFSVHCADCGTEYHPRVHSHPGRVVALGLVTVLVFVAIGGLVLAERLERSWLLWAKVGAAGVVAWLGWQAARLQKRMLAPKLYTRDSAREPEFGEIVLECPRCGSARTS